MLFVWSNWERDSGWSTRRVKWRVEPVNLWSRRRGFSPSQSSFFSRLQRSTSSNLPGHVLIFRKFYSKIDINPRRGYTFDRKLPRSNETVNRTAWKGIRLFPQPNLSLLSQRRRPDRFSGVGKVLCVHSGVWNSTDGPRLERESEDLNLSWLKHFPLSFDWYFDLKLAK